MSRTCTNEQAARAVLRLINSPLVAQVNDAGETTRRVPVEYAVRLFDAGARWSSNVLVEETAAFLAAAWAHPSQPHRRKWWEK